MSDELKTSAYDKLTPQRKLLVDAVLKNLEKGTGLWEQGWSGGSAPVSAITGKQYNGVNRVFLLLASMEKGYSDNRWLTYKQMEDKGWHFKTDEEGKSLGKGAGVAIEYFELRDKETKQPFDRHTLDGMTAEERAEYMDENVYPLRKYYRSPNARGRSMIQRGKTPARKRSSIFGAKRKARSAMAEARRITRQKRTKFTCRKERTLWICPNTIQRHCTRSGTARGMKSG